jgi:hypothetical protein
MSYSDRERKSANRFCTNRVAERTAATTPITTSRYAVLHSVRFGLREAISHCPNPPTLATETRRRHGGGQASPGRVGNHGGADPAPAGNAHAERSGAAGNAHAERSGAAVLRMARVVLEPMPPWAWRAEVDTAFVRAVRKEASRASPSTPRFVHGPGALRTSVTDRRVFAMQDAPAWIAHARLADERIEHATKTQLADVAPLLALNIGDDHQRAGDVPREILLKMVRAE